MVIIHNYSSLSLAINALANQYSALKRILKKKRREKRAKRSARSRIARSRNSIIPGIRDHRTAHFFPLPTVSPAAPLHRKKNSRYTRVIPPKVSRSKRSVSQFPPLRVAAFPPFCGLSVATTASRCSRNGCRRRGIFRGACRFASPSPSPGRTGATERCSARRSIDRTVHIYLWD